MPCTDCERNDKLRSSVICPDPWMNGASKDGSSSGRKKNENKLLTTKARYSPYGGGKAGGSSLGLDQKCTICRKQLAAGGKYCGECAHRKGVCYICGKQILDVEFYSGHGDLEVKMPSKKEIMAAKPTVTAGPKKKKEETDDLDFAERQAARVKAAEAAKAGAAEAAAEAAERQKASESRGAAAQGVAQGLGDVGENNVPKAAAETGAGAGAGAAQKPAAAAAPAEPSELRRVGAWVELQSGTTVYYYNTSTQSTQYECPEEFNAPPPSIEMTGGWQELAAADGRTYYYHAAGNLTTWKKPATYKL